MTDKRMYSGLVKEIRKTIPKFRVERKGNSKLMRFLGAVFFFNKDFMGSFVTTIYPVVYVPSNGDDIKFYWPILAHEWVHLLRARRNLLWFSFSYLLPLSLFPLSLFSMLAIWGSSAWLWNLLWIVVAALPIPSYYRTYEERIAYRMSMAVEIWRFGSLMQASRDSYAREFTSSKYYFMWPFKGRVRRFLEKEEKDILDGKYSSVAPYSVLHDLIAKEKAGLL